MTTTWPELKPQLVGALIDAFTEGEFAQMLEFGCQQKLAQLVADRVPFPQKVYEVVGVAERYGWLDCLARASKAANRSHGKLQTATSAFLAGMEADGQQFYQGHAVPALSPPDARLRFLQAVIERADQYLSRELYTDMATEAAPVKPAIKGRSAAAGRVLDRQHRVFKDRRHGLKDDLDKSQSIDSFEAFYNYVHSAKHVALIGDPGSGKTTTLLHLARTLALAAIEDPQAPLPLFVPLSMVKSDNFDELLAAQMVDYDLDLKVHLPDKLFLLLDGLNEMPGAYAAALPKWLERNPDVAVIVSCRKLDYFGFRLPLNRIDIVPLDVVRIDQFLRRYLEDVDADKLFWRLAGKHAAEAWTWWRREWAWRTPIESPQKDEGAFSQFWHGRIDRANAWEREKSYLKQMQDSLRKEGQLPGLLGIATNPFFLMAIVDIYRSNGDLHQNRGQLIAEFVNMLMTQGADARLSISLTTKPVDPDRNALADMAYQMQSEQMGTVVDVSWVVKTLAKTAPGIDVERMLYHAASSQILNVVPGETVRFTHQLLQEYFAAVKLEEVIGSGVEAQTYWPDEAWWKQTGWEESFVLLAGLKEDATPIVEWLTPVQPSLAFRCATESGATCATAAMQALYEPAANARVSPEARCAWGKQLALQGDRRAGVGLDANGLPDIDWCEVPEGEFLFGYYRETRKLPVFRIARYPVTVMQYQAFIDAPDGYQNSAWWQGLTFSRYRYPEFDYANHPRENVSWFDAIAFCRWLSAKLGREIALPTELQWEKAARGSDGRIWPWGNEYCVGYANVDERDEHNPVGPTYLRTTTAVGLYPWAKSPYGVMDMCGNVWEWCLNDARDPEGMTMGDPTVEKQLRGGSWNNNIDVAPTYHRYTSWVQPTLWPTFRNWRVGFRLVVLD